MAICYNTNRIVGAPHDIAVQIHHNDTHLVFPAIAAFLINGDMNPTINAGRLVGDLASVTNQIIDGIDIPALHKEEAYW